MADVRKADLKSVGAWLCTQIAAALDDEGQPVDTLGQLEPDQLTLAKTASRQVLGFMNEMAHHAEWEAYESGGLGACDIEALNRNLRRDLHNYNGRYATPLELVTGRRR